MRGCFIIIIWLLYVKNFKVYSARLTYVRIRQYILSEELQEGRLLDTCFSVDQPTLIYDQSAFMGMAVQDKDYSNCLRSVFRDNKSLVLSNIITFSYRQIA